jgi:hypothetical protein
MINIQNKINTNNMLSSTVKDIISSQKNKSHREKEVKEKIITTIIDKIKNYSSYGKTNCTYNVPPFVLGCIAYDYEDMINYIISKLYHEGLFVKQIFPGIIYISWDIKDIQRVQNSKRKSKTEVKTVSFSDFASKDKIK